MDPISLAGAAVALLAPYIGRLLQGGAERAAEDLGDAAAGKLGQLLSAVKRRLSGDSYARGALDRFEGEPEDELRGTVLKDAIAEVVTGDPDFARQLEALVNEAAQASGTSVEQIVVGSGAVAGRDFIQTATYAAGRDQVIGGQPASPGELSTPSDERS